MGCHHPLWALKTAAGSVVFVSRQRDGDCSDLQLPCGRCTGCRLERSQQWAARCVHEASLHAENCAVTLTYAPENLPALGQLVYRDFQLFMKRLIKSRGPTRFYMGGEYGEEPYAPYFDKFGRPHFHALLFGYRPRDLQQWQKSNSGTWLYRSKSLEKLWPYGHSLVGEADYHTAAYIARYIMKKVNGDLAKIHYQRTDPETGEIVMMQPEFCHMSLKNGAIGVPWLKKYHRDVYTHDRLILRGGKEGSTPRAYDRWFKENFPVEWAAIQMDRNEAAAERFADNTPDRLAVKEQVNDARLRFFKRSMK